MRFPEIEVGTEDALRLRAATGEPLIRVLVLAKVVRNKQLKVRHLEGPNAGMEEFFPFSRVLVAWRERRAFLKEEEQLTRVRDLSRDVDFPLIDAVQFVLDASGERGLFVHSIGQLSAGREPLLRVAARSGLERSVAAIDTAGFVDRAGRPWDRRTL